jgi:hypothetical protein
LTVLLHAERIVTETGPCGAGALARAALELDAGPLGLGSLSVLEGEPELLG